MNRSFLAVVLIMMGLNTHAQQNIKNIETKITDVTVFMNGAQVTESGNIQLKEGENQLRISDLTLYMDPNSVQVEGNPNYTIMSVRHQVNYMVDQSSNPRVRGIQDSLEDLQFRQKEIRALRDGYNDEINLIRSNNNIKGQGTLIPEDLNDMADLFRSRLKEIRYKMIELEEQEGDNNEQIQRLQNTLNNMNNRKGSNPSEILLTIQAPKAGNGSFKVSYVVQNAGWYPVYDLRAEDINKPIQFAYRAKVYQSTGTDWEDVNLVISTGNPTVGGQVPQLYPWYVNIYDPHIYTRGVNAYDGQMKEKAEYNATPSIAGGEEMDMAYAPVPQTSAGYTSIQNTAVNTEFKISIPYDIPSDNQHYDVTMQEQTLNAQYAYITIPKLDNDAFLRAQVTDWAQYSLLPGESNIYFKGTFVGKGFIDPSQANDTLNLSLGRDRGISVKRDQVKEFSKTSFLGGKQQTTRAYDITVQNNKKQSVELVIEDQIPISQNGEIEVDVEELSGAEYNEETGKLTWKVTLAPGETVKKQLRFSVKYPKKKYIPGL